MEKLLIINEKFSQKQTFAKALGGNSGTFNGYQYDLVNTLGHIFNLVAPQAMVPADKAYKYNDWQNLSSYPWEYSDFSWRKKLDNKKATIFNEIKATLKDHDAIVIATDNDPSGEGDLLGWEVIDGLKWTGKVYRLKFNDSEQSIRASFNNMIDISDRWKSGEYLEALGRQQFDTLSMQLSPISTIIANQTGFKPSTQRLGRLKSAILNLVYLRTKERDEYVKKPYYEVQFKDANNNVFKRDFNSDNDSFRFSDRASADNDLKNYQTSSVRINSKVIKKQAPPALPDLGQIGILVSKQGFANKEVISTYQKMYEAHIVTYPRTEDVGISQEQFEELLPLVNQIAQVVNVDPSKLTHRTLRKKHLDTKAEHGANRPWYKVPTSLAEIQKNLVHVVLLFIKL